MLDFIKNRLGWIVVAIATWMGHVTHAQVYDKVVAQDGSGTSKSISSAIARIVNTSSDPVLIYIKNGVYEEKIEITSSQQNLCFIGESVDGVIITNGDYSGDDESHTTATSYTLKVNGDGFYAENLTIVNSAGDVGQAVALMTDADQQVFKNCKIKGFQDTYYALSGKQYFSNCYIEGATDYVFGDGTVYLDSCQINSLDGGQYITAPADSKITSTIDGDSTMIHGLLFNECTLTADEEVADESYYLGRPWQPNAASVFVNCTLGSHINPEGWSTWSDDNHLSSFFAEYKSLDESGTLVDVSGRVDWSYQLSDDYATNYYTLDYFLTEEGTSWNPLPTTYALEAPVNLNMNSTTLTWDEVSGAIGYVIVRNDSTIGFSETNTFTDEEIDLSDDNTYLVKSVNTYGNLSGASEVYTLGATGISKTSYEANALTIVFTSQGTISVTRPATIYVYGTSGKLIKQYNHTESVSLQSFPQGIYLIRAVDNQNNVATEKIWLQ